MVDRQQEDVVSQPMRAWEERSTKIIRNCLKQLSCDKREKERTKERKGKVESWGEKGEKVRDKKKG